MFLKHIDLTTALRPSYLPDEVLLFVQDNVGLYEGKFKLPNQQNGQVYLTTHRICYVDKNEPRLNSAALELKDVDRYEFYAGFLKSSAKITLIPKPLRRSGLQSRSTTVAPNSRHSTPTPNSEGGYRPPTESQNVTAATWVCKICSFSNPVPANFDATTANAHTPLPPCLACGIKPTLQHVLKAAISNASKRSVAPPQAPPPASERTTDAGHPTNEYFGQSPVFATTPALNNDRTESPGPMLDKKAASGPISLEALDGVKISFRGGGEKIFYERLKGSMTQRKWLLHNAPPPPKGRPRDGSLSGAEADTGVSERRTKTAGIAGLEQLGLSRHKNNELLIGSAFEDLEALMASAKEVIALAEKFSLQKGSGNGSFSAEENAILAESASQLGLVTTKDMVGGSGGSESLYLSELARNLAEFLTDDTRSVLKKAGGILTLVDLWAMFNRARGGVELVSPLDFEKAARLWESLKMPVRLRTFRSGVMVVQGRDRTDETTIKTLLSWLQDLHEFPPERDVLWDWRAFGRGVTAQEAAERFGWSLGVAEEELLMAEEHGAVCREEGLEGLKFWKNYIGSEPIDDSEAEDPIIARLRSAALI
ncbi:hypothetical protein LMH87_010544 [Akanthomyces muscarius]|uniref:Vacuolar protein-sorting-associated protein 36 n=1 Tax=Akanthomyces muscarius TaxID=2231603 RepID=A0A9W8QDZ8_AKAMU|nr:hypothetical protein LMH87_010544 [Akanthomyces muscarius]KAJ4154081.1 hypothetical protein LMH87_010544 [Akanthomyces muscarius]